MEKKRLLNNEWNTMASQECLFLDTISAVEFGGSGLPNSKPCDSSSSKQCSVFNLGLIYFLVLFAQSTILLLAAGIVTLQLDDHMEDVLNLYIDEHVVSSTDKTPSCKCDMYSGDNRIQFKYGSVRDKTNSHSIQQHVQEIVEGLLQEIKISGKYTCMHQYCMYDESDDDVMKTTTRW